MSKIRIINGNSPRLESLLGELKQHVTIKLGDAIVACDPAVETEVEVSRAVFEKLLTQGYTAYKVDEEGKSKGPIYNYDPLNLTTVLFGPVGGG